MGSSKTDIFQGNQNKVDKMLANCLKRFVVLLHFEMTVTV